MPTAVDASAPTIADAQVRGPLQRSCAFRSARSIPAAVAWASSDIFPAATSENILLELYADVAELFRAGAEFFFAVTTRSSATAASMYEPLDQPTTTRGAYFKQASGGVLVVSRTFATCCKCCVSATSKFVSYPSTRSCRWLFQ